MPTFLDESGCCGFGPGSQPYFRLVAVWFPTGDLGDACGEAIAAVRASLRLPRDYEFKYSSRLTEASRVTFFRAVAGREFCFAAAHFDKLAQPGAVDKDGLYRACIGALTRTLSDHYCYAEELKSIAKGRPVRLAEKVVADDNHDGVYFRALRHEFFALKSAAGRSLVGDVRPGKSDADPLLQLADMLCGAVGDHLAGESGMYNLIAGNCLGVIRLPEMTGAGGEDTTRPA
ncbi:MAG: hypothetical protein C0501_25300 [Isosphaera sp.]|nr:hypothetical protein [Isosphaera sp.]